MITYELAKKLKDAGFPTPSISIYETLLMLTVWADTIILTTQEGFHPLLELKGVKEKVIVCDVGRDRYFRGFEQDLIDQYELFLIGKI